MFWGQLIAPGLTGYEGEGCFLFAVPSKEDGLLAEPSCPQAALRGGHRPGGPRLKGTEENLQQGLGVGGMSEHGSRPAKWSRKPGQNTGWLLNTLGIQFLLFPSSSG